jgi:hypothetical protein
MSFKDGYALFAARKDTPKKEQAEEQETRPKGTVTSGRELFSETRNPSTPHNNGIE